MGYRMRFEQRKLRKRYGVVGLVAGRYLEAGYHVRLMHPTRYGPAHIVVQGRGEKFVIEVVHEPGALREEVVEGLLKKAELLGARPILAVYGRGVKLGDLRKKLEERGVKVKYVR
ncbi:MAG: hypothetical protein DRJ96_02080 [Thermoprotei archaeon]|nr:MAG: hypothetical protein DRJ67_07855 [Thermoprotei archaeon]RLE98094.1 MAG: hypothetical protein DRJ96_02080 [Thermoprotei archaeon]